MTYYNIMRIKHNNVKNAFSTLDIMLKKRYDLVPNLVNTVKGYMKHEKETLTLAIKLRNMVTVASNEKEFFEINNNLEDILSKINFLAESYPNLKADEHFLDLQRTMYDIEENISAARRTYNAHVTDYNNFIMIFPNSIISKLFLLKELPLFTISNKERKGKIWYNEK